MDATVFFGNIVFGITQFIFSISFLITGIVCAVNNSLSQFVAGMFVGAAIIGFINNARMLILYCWCKQLFIDQAYQHF
jgi:hypothetical protein